MKVRGIKEPLIGQVVHCKNRCRGGGRIGRQIGTGHGGVPIMQVQDIGFPGGIQLAGRQVGSNPTQQRETLQVVRPFLPASIQIRIALSFVKKWGFHQVNR